MVTLEYSLNNLVDIRLEDGLLPRLDKQFSYWRAAKKPDRIDLSIERGKPGLRTLIKALGEYSFFEGGFIRETAKGRTEFRPGRVVIEGEVDDDQIEGKFIIPWMNHILLQKGWCLAHASAVVYEGRTIILPAMGGSGKTSVMLEFMSRGADFLGDDRVMIGEQGEMALYPRWVHMLECNWSFFPELFVKAFPDRTERREHERRLRRYRRGLTMRAGNPATRILKEHYRSRYYYDARVRPESMFPDSKVVLASKADSAFFLERCDADPSIVESSPSRLARLSVSSIEIEASGIFQNLSIAAGIDGMDYAKRIKVMEGFYANAKCHEARMKSLKTRNEVTRAVDRLIEFL